MTPPHWPWAEVALLASSGLCLPSHEGFPRLTPLGQSEGLGDPKECWDGETATDLLCYPEQVAASVWASVSSLEK
jgi:hypothetical protein